MRLLITQKNRILAVLILFFVCAYSSCKEENTNNNEIENESELKKEDVANPEIDPNPIVDHTKWEIKDGRFFLDGEWVFLKIGKPLINFSDERQVEKLIDNLDILQKKYYNTLELNCYWHQFDLNGDGVPDKSLDPLNKLINAIYEKGMYPCLSVETYSVGGGVLPEGFWEKYPDAYAIDYAGNKVNDTEYGFGSDVVSIFHAGYRTTVHKYIKNLAKGIDTKKILWFETTVEPQYMGTIHLCFSESAREAYRLWRIENNITEEESEMPSSFPISQSFMENETWNKFRAQFLAKWVNEDAAAYREIAGEDAYVAVDYLDAGEYVQVNRDGNPLEFLTALTSPCIIQVNWTWYFPTNTPNQKAYDRVRQVISETGRDWCISEHMTFNGSDFNGYSTTQLENILENTLKNGTQLGWEFTNVLNNSTGSFDLYNDDWSPKRVISLVDNYWGYWMEKVEAAAE